MSDGSSGEAQIEFHKPGDAMASASDAIWSILESTDKDFLPSLASREGTTTKRFGEAQVWPGPVLYFENMLTQHVFLATVDGVPAGLMSYISDFEDDVLDQWSPSAYITTVAVVRELRHHGVGNQLLKTLLASDEVHEPWVTTRTWSTNEASLRLFTNQGFEAVKRIDSHRMAGVDSIYMARSNR